MKFGMQIMILKKKLLLNNFKHLELLIIWKIKIKKIFKWHLEFTPKIDLKNYLEVNFKNN